MSQSERSQPELGLQTVPDLKALAAEINAEHAAVREALQVGLSRGIRAGELLIQAKTALGHGEWLPWLTENCPAVSERTAQAYMRVARLYPELAAKSATPVADLSFREAVKLLAEPQRGDIEASPDPEQSILELPGALEISAIVGMPVHPVNAVFPITWETVDAIARDLPETGLLNPIVLHKGQIVDGKIRLLACRKAGIVPEFVEWRDLHAIKERQYGGTLCEWIWTVNTMRKSYTAEERAHITADREREKAAAKKKAKG